VVGKMKLFDEDETLTVEKVKERLLTTLGDEKVKVEKLIKANTI